jgi:hypothetical protein
MEPATAVEPAATMEPATAAEPATAVESAAAMESAPTMESAPATAGEGRPAERNGDHADHRKKCNRPHDVSSRFLDPNLKRSVLHGVPEMRA